MEADMALRLYTLTFIGDTSHVTKTQFIYLFIYLFVYLFIHYLFIYSSIYILIN